eukprot:14320192-Ditylum_brightwellii.AAC.1
MLLDITGDDMGAVAAQMQGSGGDLRPDAVALKNRLLRFGVALGKMRDEMAEWANWLGNKSPPWVAYRALMACCLVALNNCPGTRPVGIGEIFQQLFAKLVIRATRDDAKLTCSNLQLCAGTKAEINGAVHA